MIDNVDKSVIYRGQILHFVSILEKCIEAYIARFFCSNPEKEVIMRVVVLGDNRLSFDGKRQIFDVIAKNYDSDWYSKQTGLNKSLVKIMEHRNILAHCMAKVDEGDQETVTYVRYKNDIEPHDYTDVEITSLIGEMVKIIEVLDARLTSVAQPNS